MGTARPEERPAAARQALASSPATGTYARIHAIVRRVPAGRVTTYGAVARLAQVPGGARQVGWAMSALPAGSRVPWHRVVNAAGRVSERVTPGASLDQRLLLEREGVTFDGAGRIALASYEWRRGRRAP